MAGQYSTVGLGGGEFCLGLPVGIRGEGVDVVAGAVVLVAQATTPCPCLQAPNEPRPCRRRDCEREAVPVGGVADEDHAFVARRLDALSAVGV